MSKKSEIKGHFSNANVKFTATETSRKVEFEIPKNEVENVTAGLIKINHARGLYEDFFTINQQFLNYILTIGLKGREWEVFVFLMSKMGYGNKILLNSEIIEKALKQNKSQVSKAIAKLEKNKVLIRLKLGKAKYEYEFNYDVLNPQLAFKGKFNKDNVKEHKILIEKETPYIKQYNINGHIDFVNGSTGEVFLTKKNKDLQ